MSDYIAEHKGFRRSAALAEVAATHEHQCEGAASGIISVQTSSAVGCQLVVEGRVSDDAPWMILHLMTTNDTTPSTPLAVTAAFSGVPTFGWRTDLQGISTLRVRVSALTSGALTINTKLSRHFYA